MFNLKARFRNSLAVTGSDNPDDRRSRLFLFAATVAAVAVASIQPAFAAEPSLVLTPRCEYGRALDGGTYDIFGASLSGSGLPAESRLVVASSISGFGTGAFAITTDSAGNFASTGTSVGFPAATRTIETLVFTATVFNDLNDNFSVDPGEAIVSSTISVTCPLTAEQKLTNLIAELRSSSVAPGNSFLSKLQAIEESLGTNNQVACNQLSALEKEVLAQAGKKLTQAEADELISAIASIKAAASCT